MTITQTTAPAPAGPPRRGFLHRRFGRLIGLGQYGFPFAIGRYATPVGRFRALARRSRFARAHPAVRLVLFAAMTLLWPLGAFNTARRTCRMARLRGRDYGSRQLRDMVRLALRHSITPLEYAAYHFEDPARRADMHEYVYWNDLPGLLALMAMTGADNRDVQDKDCFADICARHGYPHVATLAVFERGRQVFPAAAFIPDTPVLWIKALRLKGGAQGARWTRDGAVYRNAAGEEATPQQLVAQWRKTDCIVQPCLQNHPALAAITNGAPVVVRIVTGMNRGGTAEFVAALPGLAHGARETTIAGILCSVDPDTGVIRRAALPDNMTVERHPDTGMVIAGTVLPFWRETIELVLRAHAQAFEKFPFLGWDVALTPDGPVLLETNSGWGALFHQTMDGPLGETFSRLMGQWV